MPRAAVSAPHILVADADADVRTYIAGCLHVYAGVRTSQASDGREALYLARALAPDLIVAGHWMPGLNGAALCRALHARRATRAIPVLLVRDEPSRANDRALGDGEVVKPFNASHLRTEVERLLGTPLRPRLHDAP